MVKRESQRHRSQQTTLLECQGGDLDNFGRLQSGRGVSWEMSNSELEKLAESLLIELN